jgi:serine/threonine protein kinase
VLSLRRALIAGVAAQDVHVDLSGCPRCGRAISSTPTVLALAPRARLGPYEIVSASGSGGMGEVYKAKDTRLDRIVAVRVLSERHAPDDTSRARFQREARAISSLNHPHICTVHDVGRDAGIDYLVMEYVHGETLAERLRKGGLPPAEALAYATGQRFLFAVLTEQSHQPIRVTVNALPAQ